MTFPLPDDLERFIHDQVQAGRYPSEGDVVRDALERLREQGPAAAPGPGSIGAMRDDADLLDRAVEHALLVREGRPRRLGSDE